MQFLAFCLNRTDDILSADYKGAVNLALDTVESAWQILAAAILITADIVGMIWANGGREAVASTHRFWDDEFIPAVESAVRAVYLAGVYSRVVWRRVNSPLFISLW